MPKLKLAQSGDPKTMTTEELWNIVHVMETKDAAFEAACREQLAARLQEDAQAGGDLRERVRRNLRMQKDA